MQTGYEIHLEHLKIGFFTIFCILVSGFASPCYFTATLQTFPLLLLLIPSGAGYYFEFPERRFLCALAVLTLHGGNP